MFPVIWRNVLETDLTIQS